MKKPIITFLLLCSFWGNTTQAQYTFSVSTAPYLNLSGGTSIPANHYRTALYGCDFAN